jgi:hypothetical protein
MVDVPIVWTWKDLEAAEVGNINSWQLFNEWALFATAR